MKDRGKRQKRKLLLSVLSVLLAAWAVVSVIFCFAVVRIEINNQFNEEKYNEEIIMSELQNDYMYPDENGDLDQTLYFDMETEKHKNKAKAESYFNETSTDTQLVAVFDCGFESYFDTDKAIFAVFSGKRGDEYDADYGGLIDFEAFKASMKADEYKEITKALKTEPDEQGNRYYLVCTEFYFDDEFLLIKPKTVDLVYRQKERDWHIASQIVKSYNLKPENVAGLHRLEMDKDQSNVIPVEFVLNEFTSGGLIDFDGDVQGFVADLHNKNAVENPKIEMKTPFTCVFSNASPLEVIAFETVEMTGGGNFQPVVMLHTGYIAYAKEINIFNECKDFMLLGLAGIFVFFILLGVVMYVMFSKIINTQLTEEKKRREITNALAHDIKTPLFIISGYAQNLKENINAEKQEHYVDRIIERSKEVNVLVHKMLDLSKLDSPDYVLLKEKLDLKSIIENVLSDYQSLNDNKSIKLSIVSLPDISADRSLMTRIVTNLMENAVRYSDVQTVISVELTDKYMSVSNVSSLISEEEIAHLTEPYYRGDKTRKTKGSGLGLSAVKSIAEMHGFSLNISLLNNVITFKITF